MDLYGYGGLQLTQKLNIPTETRANRGYVVPLNKSDAEYFFLVYLSANGGCVVPLSKPDDFYFIF